MVKVFCGIFVGFYVLYLIVESIMIFIDNCLVFKGINFICFVDDIIVFCKFRNYVK